MLGIEDPWVLAAYLSCIISALFCLIWGLFKWNEEDPDTESEDEIRDWVEEESRIETEI